jgi:general secretion pathway protein A
MILRHFKLREQPFGVTPDPRYLYASATHREALASLLYGIQSGLGFVALTAKPGMGKTTLLFEVLGKMKETTKTVFLFQTILTPVDLVRALLIDLGVSNIHGSLVEMQSQLNQTLVAHCAAGKRLVVAIDEAQNLNESVLEAVRMLSNFETARQKLMQIILSGQPQLAETLALPQLLQLRQRISIFGQLKPLTVSETTAYVHHRLQIAGHDSAEPIFTNSALALIARHSEGIPRNINNICFNALSLGCALQCKTVDVDVIQEVVSDLDVNRNRESAAVPEPMGLGESRSVPTARSFTPAAKSKRRVFFLAAATCVLWLLFGSPMVQNYRAISTDGLVQASAREAPSVSSIRPEIRPGPVPDPLPTSVPEPQTWLIEAHKGQSLYHICVESFGKCRPEVLREIVRLNSSIRPRHIKPGQKIVLPIAPLLQ